MANRLELIYNIKELLREHTDDTLVADRHILYLHDLYRAKLLRQLYSDRAKKIDQESIQALCLEMEVVDKGLCGITTNCTLLRSKQRLPNLLSLRSRTSLVGVSPAYVGAKEFEVIDRADVETHQDDKYAGDAVFIQDGYVFAVSSIVDNPMLIECINIEAVFDKPSQLDDYTNCCGCDSSEDPCVDDTTEYPCPGHVLSDVSQLVLNNILGVKQLDAYRDTDNDSVPAGKEIRWNGRRRQR